MTSQAADCHGCLVCHSFKRPLRCADCLNQALREKWQFSDEAQARCKAARDALAAALQVSVRTCKPSELLLQHSLQAVVTEACCQHVQMWYTQTGQ